MERDRTKSVNVWFFLFSRFFFFVDFFSFHDGRTGGNIDIHTLKLIVSARRFFLQFGC